MDERRQFKLESQWSNLDREDENRALGDLLSTPHGRKYLWRLLRIGRVGIQPFATNALQTSFACGELNVGQQILDHIISVDPAGYVRMMQEQADERTKRDAARGGDISDGDIAADE